MSYKDIGTLLGAEAPGVPPTGIKKTIREYLGHSDDTKPTGLPIGSTCTEYDTGIKFTTWDGKTWVATSVRVTLADPTVAVIQYDTIGKPIFQYNQAEILTSILDSTQTGAKITTLVGNATNTMLTSEFTYGEPEILKSEDNDELRAIMQDSMAGFVKVRMTVIGYVETVCCSRRTP